MYNRFTRQLNRFNPVELLGKSIDYATRYRQLEIHNKITDLSILDIDFIDKQGGDEDKQAVMRTRTPNVFSKLLNNYNLDYLFGYNETTYELIKISSKYLEEKEKTILSDKIRKFYENVSLTKPVFIIFSKKVWGLAYVKWKITKTEYESSHIFDIFGQGNIDKVIKLDIIVKYFKDRGIYNSNIYDANGDIKKAIDNLTPVNLSFLVNAPERERIIRIVDKEFEKEVIEYRVTINSDNKMGISLYNRNSVTVNKIEVTNPARNPYGITHGSRLKKIIYNTDPPSEVDITHDNVEAEFKKFAKSKLDTNRIYPNTYITLVFESTDDKAPQKAEESKKIQEQIVQQDKEKVTTEYDKEYGVIEFEPSHKISINKSDALGIALYRTDTFAINRLVITKSSKNPYNITEGSRLNKIIYHTEPPTEVDITHANIEAEFNKFKKKREKIIETDNKTHITLVIESSKSNEARGGKSHKTKRHHKKSKRHRKKSKCHRKKSKRNKNTRSRRYKH